MGSVTRRAFLEKLSTFGASLFVSSGVKAIAETRSEPHITFPTIPRDRIAVASYPFRAYIESPRNRDRDAKLPGMDLAGFAAHMVEKFAVHNIEPLDRHFRSTDAAYLTGLRDALNKSEVKVVDIPVSTGDSFYDADAVARKKAVAAAKQWIDVAVQIGSPSIRTHIRGAKNSSPDVPRTVESFKEVSDYAVEKNVVVTLENDDLVSEDAFFIVKVIEGVNNPYLRALPDFANSIMAGNADFNYRALQAMFQHAYSICHVKDGEADDHGKQYNIDLKKSFDILKASGFRGYCSMEYDAPGDPYAPTAKLIEQTIRYLA